MSLLERLGLVTIAAYRSKRRLAWFVLAIFAAIMTPPFDILSMMFLWVPLGVLYEMGVLLCVWSQRHRRVASLDADSVADEAET
jgi:Sec-independent protein secretion pathway component TatC